MAKLLHLSRPSRGVSNVVRAWWAARCQKLRRQRSQAGPLVVPAPVITDGYYLWDETEPGWADAMVLFSFDDPGLPVATFEIYVSFEVGDGSFGFWESISSTVRGFRQNLVFTGQNGVIYKLRYRNGDVIGPFSEEFDIRM
jgi:hypothetical protein